AGGRRGVGPGGRRRGVLPVQPRRGRRLMVVAGDDVPVDAFDLPGWLGEQEVRWTALSSLGTALVTGRLDAPGDDAEAIDCDLLACDLAYPQPVLAERW